MARLPPAEPSVEERAFRAVEGTLPPNLQLLMAHAPQVARLQLEFLRACTDGLPARTKELIILQVGLMTDNAYCWGHHVPPGLAAGLTAVEIMAIRSGDHASLPSADRLLLEFTRAVVEQAVTDELWAEFSEGRTHEQMVKITALVGFYCLQGKIQAALQAAQDDGFGGFEVPS